MVSSSIRPETPFRGTVGRICGDLSQEDFLRSQGLEIETSCLSDHSPFNYDQLSLVNIKVNCLSPNPTSHILDLIK